MVIRDEGEKFFSEEEDQRGRSLWETQHLLQHWQHTFPTKHTTQLVSIKTAAVNKVHQNLFGCCTIPAALLVGVQTPNEVDELLGDELLCHDQLQLVEICPLLLWQDRHRLQIPASVRRPGRSVNIEMLVQRLNRPDQVKLHLLPELKRFYISPVKVISISCSIR